MFIKISRLKRKLRDVSLSIFNKIENNGNYNFSENGEELFITNLARSFKIAKIMKNGLELREYQPYMDNFNYSNYVAVSKRLI